MVQFLFLQYQWWLWDGMMRVSPEALDGSRRAPGEEIDALDTSPAARGRVRLSAYAI